jgi:hypothetical protein
MDDEAAPITVAPQVGDRVIVDVDAESFEGPHNLAYFEGQLQQRGFSKPFDWCIGSVSHARGHVVARFPHEKRRDQMPVFIVNVDGKGLVAMAAQGLKLRVWCGANVLILPRASIEMRSWRTAALSLFAGVAIVPADSVARCVGVAEACVPHPSCKYQFAWLVRLVDADDVFTVAHSIDLRPWSASKTPHTKNPRQLVTMIPASSALRPLSASFPFQGVGASAMMLSADTDDDFVERQLKTRAPLEGTPYLQHFFLAAPDDNTDYS